MSDDDAFRVAAEKPDEIRYAIVAYGTAGLCVFADQPFRPDEAALRNDEVQTSEQAMKTWLDLDEIRSVKETLSTSFYQITNRLHALAVHGGDGCDRVGAYTHRIRNDPDHWQHR